MTEHSETAWKIASLYSRVLASETRDLAAHIDVAIAAERERCAKVCDDWIKTFGKGSIQHVPATEYATDAVADIADLIREPAAVARSQRGGQEGL